MSGWTRRPPTEQGWYGVTVCWDASGGIFTRAAFFDGVRFITEGPVTMRSSQPFPDREPALSWAERNDPESSLHRKDEP